MVRPSMSWPGQVPTRQNSAFEVATGVRVSARFEMVALRMLLQTNSQTNWGMTNYHIGAHRTTSDVN